MRQVPDIHSRASSLAPAVGKERIALRRADQATSGCPAPTTQAWSAPWLRARAEIVDGGPPAAPAGPGAGAPAAQAPAARAPHPPKPPTTGGHRHPTEPPERPAAARRRRLTRKPCCAA